MPDDYSNNVDINNIELPQVEEDVYVLPMSFAQQRLWFLDQFEPDSPFYNIPTGVRFKGNLQKAVLVRAINKVIERHETLRTTFETVQDEASQIIHPYKPREFPVIDITDVPAGQQEARILNLARREAATPFNLRKGPLLRVTFIKAAEHDHVILITMHHIISDGWSMGVFVSEITTLYAAFSAGQESPLPALPIQYGDFAEWQQHYIAGEVLEKQQRYWKKQLGGSLPILELPGDRPRPTVQTMVGANAEILVPEEITHAFKEMSRRAGVTLYMSLLAAFKVLLHRYTGLDDIIVGSPIANRNRAEIEPLIGFFVNTLVLRSNLADDPKFSELLAALKQTTMQAYDNQDIPFERLVEILQPQRDMAHSPLFQVMFILQNTPMTPDLTFSDVTIQQLDVDAGTSTYDVTLMVNEGAKSFSITAEYNTDIYDDATMQRLLQHYVNLLGAVATFPDARLSQLDFLPQLEKQQLVLTWNNFDKGYDYATCLHFLFEAQVQKTPDAIAVVFAKEYLTYKELNVRANKLAHYLMAKGVGPDVKVSLCLDKSINLPVAVLGVLKAGGAYVPVDPGYPEDRIAFMLEDSEAAVVVTTKNYAALLPEGHFNVVLLDADWPKIDGQSHDNPASGTVADNLAYMIYTSGSTGKAKGTMVAHKSIVNAYLAWEHDYRLRDGVDSHLQMASFSFDVFGGDFVRALLSGGKLVLVPRESLLEAEKLYALMRREHINCAEFVPAVLRNLIGYLEETGQKLDFMKNLIAGSDVWTVKEYAKFLKFCGPKTRLINSFGLTEAAVDSTFFEGDVSSYAEERLVPIGRPFPNSKIYIVDPHFNLSPIGVPGELLVAGPNLARGYFKRADLTAEKFVPNPFSNTTGERLYRTGDLARWLADGNIEFLGRIDFQIKIRGFRVELGEIETMLEKHPSIKNAVVIAREDIPGDQRLVGYVTARGNAAPDSSTLRAFLKDHVPDYMIPSAILVLGALPLTPNGKVDRKALPAPDQSAYEALQTFVEPATDTEKKLAGIWSKVLRVDKVGAEDNFFELGGHSLLATQVMSRLRATFDVELPLRNLFEYVTVRELAEVIDRAAIGASIDIPPITRMPEEALPVLSFAQERLWFLDQLEPNSPFYNIPDAIRIKGPLDIFRLEKCIRAVVQRHDVLRTTFHKQGGKPVLKIADTVDIDIQHVDLRNVPPDEREAKAKRLTTEEAQQPFDLTTAPLFRIRLLNMDYEDYIFLFTMHHIISDGWSSTIMIGEIALLYDHAADASILPPMPLQYQDFAYWQRHWLKDAVLENEINYWKETLQGSPPVLNLPTDRPRPAMQTPNGDFISFDLSKELTHALNAISQSKGVTLFMTLMSAFYVLLYRYSGQDDINIGTPVANRTRGELENLIGFFVNTLVMRGDLSNNPTFDDLLARVKKTALGAFAHQDVPFEKIVDALKVERDMSHSPLFQVMFALQNTPDQEIVTETRLQISPILAHSGTSKFDLTLFMVEEGDQLSGGFEYNTDLFDVETIHRMISHFCKLLDEIVVNSRRTISTLPMITPHEQKQILLEWNGKTAPLRYEKNIVETFNETAARFPEHSAIECAGKVLTYTELNARANALAHYLIKQGVCTDVLVGLCVPRSIEMIVGMLGVLKAGAAYVPIDMNYPPERIAYMLNDSNAPIIFTTADAAHRLPEHNAAVLRLDADWETIAQHATFDPDVQIDQENLAYMIYTSGSTGKPKGTMITHRGLTNYLDWTARAYPLEKGRGSIVHSTIAFDATVTAVFTPFLNGKTAVLLPDDADLEALSRALRHYKDFNIVKITPAHLELLGRQVPAEEAAGLTHSFIIGGENLTAEQISFWQKNAPNTLLFNEYGPTETVVGCVVYEASGWRGIGSVPIGRAITNSVVYVLNDTLEPVAAGVAGELYIGGEGVARGYLNRPDLTAERFIPNLFGKKPGERLYKTGDLVRYLNDGLLIFLGRMDSQVKIRGYRIELGEIDAVLQQHPAIDSALSLVREDSPGDKRLVSYYTVVAGQSIEHDALFELLRQQLPEYMRPVALVQLDAFPLTSSGKVDRRALPRPEYENLQSTTEFVAPRNAQEELLADIWLELLHVDRIGVLDNFFELGGHSLLATQLMSRIRDVFAVELPLRSLFETPTIVGLVRHIDSARQQQDGRMAPPLQPVPRHGDLPLSFAQQRLWFLDQLAPENANYNIPIAIKISGELDIDAIERSITEIVRRHEALRTIFIEERGTPKQRILQPQPVELPIYDLSKKSEQERDLEMSRLVTDNAMRPFKLDEGALYRGGLIRLSQEEHVLMFTMHHIISDGWSTNVLMQEFGILYQAYRANRPPQLPELAIQYADYAAWQREWLTEAVLEKQINFWQDQIGVNPPVLDLPTDYPRPGIQTFNGDAVSIKIPRAIVDGLRDLSQKHDATMFMTLLAAFQSLLYRYTHQEEILVGSPIANRNYSETEALIGFFVNTLVLRAELSNRMTFEELLTQVRDYTLDAYAHQDVPFEQLVDRLERERDMSRSPLFQVMFVLQNTPRGSIGFEQSSLAMEVVEADERAAKFDITLVMAESSDGYYAEFEYNTDLFKKESIQRMADHFVLLLQQMVKSPHAQISELELVTEAEKTAIIQSWNATDVSFPRDKCIHELFEERIARTPDAPALYFEGELLTFAELNQRVNTLAHYLRALGVGPEKLVGISVEKSIEQVVGLLGVLKAGGVYVPIDPGYPQDRIDYIMADANITVLLTQDFLAGQFDRPELHIIRLDAEWAKIADESAENPDNLTNADHLAYMIYTSGSTGQPKGTMLQHRGLVNLTLEQIKDFQLDETCRCLQFASFSFDASVSEIFTTLVSGATLYLAPKDKVLPGADLQHYLQEHKITTITLPPTALSVMSPDGLEHLRTLVSAGEACSRDIAAKWSGGRRFLNAYGPTENTVCASSYPVTELANAPTMPIGKPIGNVRLYILDDLMQLVPPGVPGELCIAGLGLARGYHNRPDLTAERFSPNPFGRAGERLYRTGDLVRYLADGNIEFLGRIDHQVKLRGFRIELGEIEQVLIRHEKIKQAVVLVREIVGRRGDQKLVAYIVAEDQEHPNDQQLREWCSESLPDYMVPHIVFRLATIPLTPNGKVDRRALPLPTSEHLQADVEMVTPRNDIERKLTAAWMDVLHLDNISVYANFFDIGGHSLLATQLISRVREQFSLQVPIAMIFESPTIAQMALSLQHFDPRLNAMMAPPIEPVAREANLPLSFAQQRLWFLDQLEPGSPMYNLPAAVRLVGQFDLDAFRKSLEAVAYRHESLRTTFITQDGKPQQVISDNISFKLHIVDWREKSEDELEKDVPEFLYREFTTPFDLQTGPLVRLHLIKQNVTTSVFVLNMHHIISDGWSMGIFIAEVAAYYEAFRQGQAPELPDLKIQYPDYAYWQRQWLKDEVLEFHLNYWKQQLAGAAGVLNLPTDRPRPAFQTFNGDTIGFEIDRELLTRLNELSRKHNATLFMTLLAAFNVLLQRYSGQDDIIVGTPIANRNTKETEALIGFFVNTLVLRSEITNSMTFVDVLNQVRQVALDAYAHQDVPFEMIVDAVQPERNMSHTPLFQVMFVLQNIPSQRYDMPDLRIEPLEAESHLAKFDLTLTLMETDQGLTGSFEYNTDLFEAGTIERMITHLQNVLRGVTESSQLPIYQIPLVQSDERQKMLAICNDVSHDFHDARCIHQIVEEQVAINAHAVAVSLKDSQLTYGELNRKANKLAHFLRRQGVAQDDLVGLCLERSLEMVIGILGILKAGAGYVPIDPMYPADRKDFILMDSGMKLLLTQEAIAQELSGVETRQVCLDSDWALIEYETSENTNVTVSPQNVAYVIYTSGSTGTPKGVMVCHENVTRLFHATENWYHFDERDIWTLFHSFAFDFSVWELWGALFYGGQVVIVPYMVSRSPENFYKLLAEKGVTVLNQTPSAFRQLIQQEELDGMAPELKLRYVIFGGDKLELGSLKPWFEEHGYVKPQLINMYGITETTVHVTYRPLAQLDIESAPGSMIGGPIPDLQIYILDQNYEPLPIGVPGELYVGGAGLARGYLRRPELTAGKFIPNPFADQPGARLYKTGDLARVTANGDIEYLGRIDHQVQLRGFRVELGEIESVLNTHPEVKEALVLLREDKPGDQKLAAYYVIPDESVSVTVNELRTVLKEKLPDYMVPAHFVRLTAFPLTAHGKIDRRVLPLPESIRPEFEHEFAEPETDDERILADIWKQVLHTEQVGRYDNFFELGGDSILSIQVISRANQAGLKISPRHMFQAGNLAELADLAQAVDPTSVEQEKAVGPAPLTPIQHWFFEHHTLAPQQFNTSLMVALAYDLDLDILQHALTIMTQHHDCFRLRFEQQESEWRQEFVESIDNLPFEMVDVTDSRSWEVKKLIEEKAAAVQKTFDLGTAPLLKVIYFRMKKHSRLLLVLHHLITDGVSWRFILEDLLNIYGQLSENQPIQLPPRTTNYKVWANRLVHYAQSEAAAKQIHFWQENQARFAPYSLPRDFDSHENTYGSAEQLTLSLSSEVTNKVLQDIPKKLGTNINDVLLTALLRALTPWTGQNYLAVEMEGHGREPLFEDVDLSRTVGWFTSIFYLNLELVGTDLREQILAIHDQLAAVPDRGVGYGILKYLKNDASTAFLQTNHAQVNFNYLGQFDQFDTKVALPFQMAPERIRDEQFSTESKGALLHIVASVSGRELHVRWLYSAHLYKERTIRRLAKTFNSELEDVVSSLAG
ncbi:amino acid adenylation domain-containing protein [candidate division KSB1 bacterium]|nr:non-ribosomal peptide synthase/polyketide synthase [candidate division KSB1 bacterium]RQW04809.1 MAG: amino acid adenylation domain-containing protein [candidate division KSB1 bacterium]